MESIKYIYWQDQDHWLGYLPGLPRLLDARGVV